MRQVLNKLFAHQYLTRDEAKQILTRMATGEFNESQIASFMTVFLMRSITIEEFWGFADAMIEQRVNIDQLSVYNPIDIVGTGGDGKNTFNISTLACFVVAAAGYKVAKHGNYGASSISGASTVMEQYGVNFTNDLGKLERSLADTNIVFLHAPLFNNAMKVVAPVRKALSVRSFFNMLGPVVNPIRPKRTVLGVFNLRMARMYHYTYQQTDVDYSIVHSMDGYDEVSLTDTFKVINRFGEKLFTPEELTFKRCAQDELSGGDTPRDAAQIFGNIINDRATDAQKNAVIVNAAIGIHTIHPEKVMNDCIAEAREAIESGKVKETFKQFLALNS